MAGSSVRVDDPSSVVITFSRESSIKIKSFLSQWIADLGSDATRHFNSKGSPSDKATSRGFSLKKGTVPSITSLTVSTYKFGNLINKFELNKKSFVIVSTISNNTKKELSYLHLNGYF